jgi:hypothetical protein
MYIAAPVIAATTTTPPATVIAPPTATAAHNAYASGQGSQHRNRQPDLDPVNQRFRFVHTDHPFTEKTTARNATGLALFALRAGRRSLRASQF